MAERIDLRTGVPSAIADLVQDEWTNGMLGQRLAGLAVPAHGFGDFSRLQRSAEEWARRWQDLGELMVRDSARVGDLLHRAASDLRSQDECTAARVRGLGRSLDDGPGTQAP